MAPVNFKTDALDREINPDNANVKFHTKPIDEVLKLQRETGIL